MDNCDECEGGDPKGVKRKRSLDQDSCEEDPEPPSASPEMGESSTKTARLKRKRKFVYTSDSTVPKKCRKFYFINTQMTKPRKQKLAKPEHVQEQNVETIPGNKHKLHFAKFDASGNVVLVHKLHQKFDLFFSDEKKCNYEASKSVDLSFHVVDEIALEGLDGITLEAFWKRLKFVFPNHINKTMADRIWRLICNNKRVNIFILKEPREELIFFDRCKYLDIDSGFFVEPFIEFNDIYPMASVNGTEVRGSCSTFDTRKENNGVRKFSMDKAIKLYDQKLVFVADQALRNKALIDEEADPNIELLDFEYCILEKIGRSRDQGEVTQGKIPLVNDSKRVYHTRKVLLNYSLIVHQNFFLKSLSLNQNISGGLVHLKRFYSKRKTKYIVIMERIANILRNRPNHQIDLVEFRQIFGRNVSMIKLVKTADFRRFFKISTFPYRKFYPNATQHEYMCKSKQRERQVKVLRMLDPCANITAIMDVKDSKELQPEKPAELGRHKFINYEYLRDIFLYILSTGYAGVSIQEINNHFGMDFYSVRLAVRKLLLRNVIDSNKIDLGRQQTLKFFAKCFSMPGCYINTQPKNYELSPATLSRVLAGYENKIVDESIETSKPEPAPIQTQFNLNFEPFCCTSFLTEMDPSADDLTIYDIVIKGRDKLLLIGSNLCSHYISEWDEFLLKRDDYSKGIQLFQTGFGKVIYEFLSSVRTNDIETDNCIVFSLENVTANTKIAPFKIRRVFKAKKNYNNPHSDGVHTDTISKIYLFEAMSETHRSNQVVDKLRNIFERLMVLEGKRKRFDSVKLEPAVEFEESGGVVMEKFMGPSPYLAYSEEQEGIKLEIFASTKPKCNRSGLFFVTDDENLTQRYVNRANILLKSVYSQEVVRDVHFLYKDVLEEENLGGYDKKICRKTIVSIIARLVDEGYIKVFKVVMTEKHITRTQCFICVLETDVLHTQIKSTIDQMKLKFSLARVPDKPVKIKKKIESPFNMVDVKESINELKQLTSAKLEPAYKFDKSKGRVYGYLPKFARMRLLHEHLFYVIRELNECEPISGRQVFELCKSLRIKGQGEANDLPAIYRNEVSWKMFIPPIPQHTTFPKGWALACDIILRMPLSVFVKLYKIVYDIPELEAYLKHPIKRHFLLKHLPVDIRSVLLRKRKYFYNIYENLCNMCYVGLLQLGPRNFKEKDQVFIYLNSKASLYDTCNSQPGYNLVEDKPYREILFEFKTGSDVEIYWSEMLRICMNTQLGKRKVLDGQCVTIEECGAKPAMVETLRPKTFQGAVLDDTGALPGDRRGAAGVDSSLWTFVKRNWVWSTRNKAQSQKKAAFEVAPVRFDSLKGGASDRRACPKPKSVMVKRQKKKLVRKFISVTKKRPREYYDALDKSIMKKNATVRVEWDEEEDQLLRYSRAAASYLCPEFKKQFIPYNVIRDVLHRICPKVRNKTAKAIQRRTYVLLTNDETIKIMENNNENFSNSETIGKYFEQVRNRYKNEVKISDSQIYICYIYLMAYIAKHRKEVELLLLGYFATFDFFTKANISEFEAILQNCDDSSPIYTDPKTVEEVTKDTIRSVVHCSMACKKNSVGWTFHLSRIYKKFADDLIRVTVANMKKDQFVVTNKNYVGKNLDGNYPTPLKFSYVYNLMKSSTYPKEMFREAFRVFLAKLEGDFEAASFMVCNELNTYWEEISFIFEIPEMGIILNPEIEDHSEVIEELAKRFRLYLDKIYEKKNAGRTPEVMETQSVNMVEDCEKIKSKVRHLIFRVPYLLEGDLELCFKKMLDSSNNLEINNYIYLMIVSLKKFTEGRNTTDDLRSFVANIEDESCVDSEEKLLKNLSKVVFVIQTIHQQQVETNSSAFESWESEIWDEVRSRSDDSSSARKSPKNYASGMEVCIKRAQDGDFPSIEEIKEGMMAEVDAEKRKIPHITDLIMLLNEGRFPELDTDNDIEKLKEHFVMQYPKLDQFVIEDLEKMKQDETTVKITNREKIETFAKMTENVVRPPQMDLIIKYLDDVSGTGDDIKIVENLIDFIKEKKELGVSGRELKQYFTNKTDLNLAHLMHYLGEIGVILRAGVASFIYVHYEYQSEWLTETFMLSREEKQIYESTEKEEMTQLRAFMGEKLDSLEPRKVQLKPWTKLDGCLNDNLFYEWLCLVFSRCIDFPNIPFTVLCEYFHYIKPVDIYSLLEVLQELDCVKIYLFDRIENNLCSARSFVEEREATSLDSFDEMFLKPTNVSGLCFGSFLDKLCPN
nr:PREDICTED: uncharacterized protein LOC100142360 isoform X1 [Tribolium castaneum]|eukprot:XP_008195802.1 PREDICTED: uncharacterized protein LOC100142360 isoform X1 [Tribolium castaneum]